MSETHLIALAGNPNAGKSTIFNALTGAHQHVGNWPGKTVEKKEGQWTYKGMTFTLVDLPGTYSLTAYSMEEIITRDYILQEQPEVVIVVVDSSNLERNLYLVVQLLEMGANVLMALNMSDVARSRGIVIDIPKLSAGLGVPVIPTTARTGEGLTQLKEAIVAAVTRPQEAADE